MRNYISTLPQFLDSQKEAKDMFGPERGAAAIEFALLGPFVLLLILGMFDLGMAIQTQQAASIASREAARAGIIMAVPRPNDASITNVATNVFNNSTIVGSLTNVQVNGAGGLSGTPLQVTVTVSHPMIILPFLIPGIFPANPVPLSGSTVMNLE